MRTRCSIAGNPDSTDCATAPQVVPTSTVPVVAESVRQETCALLSVASEMLTSEIRGGSQSMTALAVSWAAWPEPSSASE
jgi:hypothetical protein